MSLLVFGNDEPVCDDVVDVGGAHEAGISQIIHRHGDGSGGEDPGSRVGGEAHAVDGYIDLKLPDLASDLFITGPTDVDEAFEGRAHPPTYLRSVIDAERDARDLEAGPVVAFEQAGHHNRCRMETEIAGDVGDADSIVLVALTRQTDAAAGGLIAAIQDLAQRSCSSEDAGMARKANGGALALPSFTLSNKCAQSASNSTQSHSSIFA